MDKHKLQHKANWLRQQAIELVIKTKKGHIGGALSCADILVGLYYGGLLKFDSNKPFWSKRDRFILSKGHACVALYPILQDLGFITTETLNSFCEEGSLLCNHPDNTIPGIEVSTGSLGNGLGVGVGIALAGKLDKESYNTFVVVGDGECYEGVVWEAIQFAGHHKLSNLIVIVDRNKQCVTDFTYNCSCLEPFEDKWKAFNWETKVIDGHCFDDIINIKNNSDKPLVVIANTIKGKGVSFMEGQLDWHHGVPTEQELSIIKKELSWI